MIDVNYFKEKCLRCGIFLNSDNLKKFSIFSNILLEHNKKVNLTSITNRDEIEDKHFLDSLFLLKTRVELFNNSTLLDVGTGAGFPSVPISIVREDLKITQLDSSNKKIIFLNEVSKKLNLNICPIHIRAENLASNKNYREKFDNVTARAVADLSKLSELCIPFVKKGGYFLAMKSINYEKELAASLRSIKILGGRLERVYIFKLPNDNFRSIILIKKIIKTPIKYPRNFSKINNSPL